MTFLFQMIFKDFQMTRLFPVEALCALIAAPLAAQDAPTSGSFQAEMLETANTAGDARLPVACGGLFRALALISDEGSERRQAFASLEADVAVVATFARIRETGEENPAAIGAVADHIDSVSAVYLRWFTANLEREQSPLDDAVRGNFEYCRDLRDQWEAAMAD